MILNTLNSITVFPLSSVPNSHVFLLFHSAPSTFKFNFEFHDREVNLMPVLICKYKNFANKVVIVNITLPNELNEFTFIEVENCSLLTII